VFDRASSIWVNNINDQLDATIIILLIFESAHRVSGNLLPIFRSVRLWSQQYGVLSNVVVGWRSGVRRRRLCVWTVHHIAITTVLRSWRWTKGCPKHDELDSKVNKIVIVASSWSFILFTYICTNLHDAMLQKTISNVITILRISNLKCLFVFCKK
jgi:hypothetical protein